jgi:hypothetical protein
MPIDFNEALNQAQAAKDSGADPYQVDLDSAKHHVSYQNLDSSFRYAHVDEQRRLIKALLVSDFDLSQFCFPYALQVSTQSDSAFINGLQRTYSHPFNKQVCSALDKRAKWRQQTFLQIEAGLKRLAVLAPKASVAKSVYFAYTQFAASAYASSKAIVLGQERYLGRNHQLTSSLPPQQFYDWIKEGMEPQYASSDALVIWLSTNVLKSTDENFASEMIRWGKLLAILEIISPEVQLHNHLRYSEQDFEWALKAERGVWEYLVDQQMLFKTDQELNMNFLNEGPYTIGLSQESPDRMGRFLGYRIVKQYIDANQPTIPALLALPYHQILKKYEVPQ